MAKIVLGMVSSHGPLLITPPELWTGRIEADRRNPALFYRGKTYGFDALVEARASENLEPELALEVRQHRFDACQKAIAEMGRAYAEVRPDVTVMIGNDQMEIMGDENQPSFMVYFGESMDNVPFNDEQKQRLGPGVALAEPNHHPAVRRTHPGCPELALHLIDRLMGQGFDLATSNHLPERRESRLTGLPHAFGYFYQRIMDNDPPTVPVFVNTFYPPNQARIFRCHALGTAIAEAVEGWDKDLRVAILGSGGMTHFVVDEPFDRRFLAAFQQEDSTDLFALPENLFHSGNSELKNWVPVRAAMQHAGLPFTLLDYQPLYRSMAGTGSGMGFGYWK